MKERKITVRFGDKTYTAISEAAKQYERSKSDIVREAVVEWLERRGYLRPVAEVGADYLLKKEEEK